ncbi:MAG: hypothetical protein H7Z18_04960 [Methylophilaceae bacterium]|nr:hypothetical protein [Methylophilaceae bacterium]
MIALNRPLSQPYHAFAFVLGAVLLSPTWFAPSYAGIRNASIEEPVKHLFDKSSIQKSAFYKVVTDKSAIDKDNEEGLEQTLNYNFSPEARVRLRKSLSEYAKSNDPEHRQIEARRREMRESVKARFSACDKDIDDTIDRTETTECLPQVARHFNQVDINGDGLISLDELEEAQARIEERERLVEAKIQADNKAQADKARDAEVVVPAKRKSKQADNASKKSAM